MQRRNDSPVHAVLDLNIEPEGKPIETSEFFEWRLKDDEDSAIGLVTGDIQNVMGIDVWVNPENTSMQMARPFENSISGIVRYLGAEKDPDNGQIKFDTIARALADRMNESTTVDPASVLVTTSGAMEVTHKVKRIFHVAANYGQVGQGYIPIDYVARCVVNALKTTVDDVDLGERPSILFPLMATRSRKGAVLEERVRPLLNAAIEHFSRHPRGTFRRAYFLTYTDKELEVCHQLLREDARLRSYEAPHSPTTEFAAETPVSRNPATGKTSGPLSVAPVQPRPGQGLTTAP